MHRVKLESKFHKGMKSQFRLRPGRGRIETPLDAFPLSSKAAIVTPPAYRGESFRSIALAKHQ